MLPKFSSHLPKRQNNLVPRYCSIMKRKKQKKKTKQKPIMEDTKKESFKKDYN